MQKLSEGGHWIDRWFWLARRCPEVLFEEIDIDLFQTRFWITSVLPTARQKWRRQCEIVNCGNGLQHVQLSAPPLRIPPKPLG